MERRSFLKRCFGIGIAAVVTPKVALHALSYPNFDKGMGQIRNALIMSGKYDATKDEPLIQKGKGILKSWFEKEVPPWVLQRHPVTYEIRSFDYGHKVGIAGVLRMH